MIDWYDRAMKELDEWFQSGPMTLERYQEYRRCKKNLDIEYKELCNGLSRTTNKTKRADRYAKVASAERALLNYFSSSALK